MPSSLLKRLLLVSLTLAACTATQAQAIRVGTWDRSSDPLTVVSEAVLTRAYQELNQKLELVELPNRRALQALLAGELDGNLHRVHDLAASQPRLTRVNTPINASLVRIYGLESGPNPANWQQLKGLRVAYQRGILRIEQLLPAGAIRVEASSVSELFRLLAAGAADVALCTEVAQSPPLKRAGTVHRLDAVLDEHLLYHYLDARHADLAQRLAAVLRKLQSSGELETVRRQALQGHLQQTANE